MNRPLLASLKLLRHSFRQQYQQQHVGMARMLSHHSSTHQQQTLDSRGGVLCALAAAVMGGAGLTYSAAAESSSTQPEPKYTKSQVRCIGRLLACLPRGHKHNAAVRAPPVGNKRPSNSHVCSCLPGIIAPVSTRTHLGDLQGALSTMDHRKCACLDHLYLYIIGQCSQALKHTHTHTRMHTRTRAHTHTHTHARTSAN